jgi:hypothetical protein
VKFLLYLALVAAVLAVLLVLAWTQQRRLLYFPEGDPGPPPVGWNEVTIPTGDGLELTAWHRSAEDAADRPLVLVFHGNAGNRAGRVPLGEGLSSRGFDVLLIDYRGYGGNPGAPSEHGLAEDAESAARFAGMLAPDRAIVYFGESLGAAVSIGLAASMPPDGLVLVSPFTSVADVGRFHYPMAPSWLIRESYPSLERVESGAIEGVPVLVAAGSGDTIVPVSQSRMIADAAGAEWYEVPGADHNDPELRSAAAFVDRVATFIDRSVNRQGG